MNLIKYLLVILFMSGSSFALSQPKKVKLNKNAQLLEAIESGNNKLALQLIDDKEIQLDHQGHQKLTPLMMATVFERSAIVDTLLLKKVNLELKNEAGDTALAMAVGNEKIDIANTLLKAGAKVNVSCGEPSSTLLMCAVQIGNANLVKEILKLSPDELKKKNSSGQTAADIAKELGQKNLLPLLKSVK